MASFKDRLNEAMLLRDISSAELSRRSGVNEGAISQYRKGAYKANQRSLEKLSDALSVSIPWLMGSDVPMNIVSPLPKNIIPVPSTREIPLLGDIVCGEPALAVKNLDGTVSIPKSINADFALRCKGDSMINARIFDGDIVYLRAQNTVENGDIAAVVIGEEATLKRVRMYSNHIILEPANPMYEPLSFWYSQMDEVRIIGKAVGFTSFSI